MNDRKRTLRAMGIGLVIGLLLGIGASWWWHGGLLGTGGFGMMGNGSSGSPSDSAPQAATLIANSHTDAVFWLVSSSESPWNKPFTQRVEQLRRDFPGSECRRIETSTILIGDKEYVQVIFLYEQRGEPLPPLTVLVQIRRPGVHGELVLPPPSVQ